MVAWRLHLRNMGTGGGIGAAGDALMQYREGLAEWDASRTARLSAFRLCHAPVVDACWRVFDRRIALSGPAGVAARVVADQGLLMPPSIFSFFLSQGMLEGLSAEASFTRAVDSFVPAVTICLPFWCTVHTLTFGIFPPHWRMVWASVCAVGWNALMSRENQRAIAREEAPAEEAHGSSS